jgi:hypothetical protein
MAAFSLVSASLFGAAAISTEKAGRILPSTLKEDAYHHEISALAAMDEMGLEMVSARSRRVDNRLGLWTSHLPFGYFATPQKFTKSVRFV